jgi:hypothetical protein
MSDNDRTSREKVPVADLIAGDWISTEDEDPGDPVQLLWRTGERLPNDEFGWVFYTTGGLRHFDQHAWIYRVTGVRRLASVDTDSVDDELAPEVVSGVARGDVLDSVPEVTRPSETLEVARAAAIGRQLTAERAMVHAIVRAIIVALPICIAVLLGMMALALHDKQPWYAWVALGIVIGVYAAGFFGTIAGVMLSAHLLDEADQAATHDSAGAPR